MSSEGRPIISGYSEFLESSANKNGTPKSLRQAIDDALTIGPLVGIRDRTFNNVVDFLAQRFSAEIMKASNDHDLEHALMSLFKTITKEDAT